MSSPKPTLVLVPGACLTTPVFDLFLPLLEKAGYPTATLQVASADPPDPQAANATADAAALRNQLLPLLDAGKELVLVLHSYAGVPGGGAVAGLSKTVRAQQRKRGGVVGMVWMAAIVLPEGRESGEWAGLGKKGGGEEVNRYHDVGGFPLSIGLEFALLCLIFLHRMPCISLSQVLVTQLTLSSPLQASPPSSRRL